ncbi:MAG: NUDIX hydrolase [Aquihabitans sp.]
MGEGHPVLAPSGDLALAGDLLRAAKVGDPEAAAYRDEVLAFIATHADAAHRSCITGHLTGSALVVDSTATHTLLMLHRKLGRWFQPGGHADGDTNLAAVALKEASEETGLTGLRVLPVVIDVDVHTVRPPAEQPHLHLDTRFLVMAPPDAVEEANEESLALRWVTEAELEELLPPVDPGTRRLVARGLAAAADILNPPAP